MSIAVIIADISLDPNKNANCVLSTNKSAKMQPYAVGAFFFTPYIFIVFFACLFGTLFIKSCLFYPGVCVLYISWELSLINSAQCEFLKAMEKNHSPRAQVIWGVVKFSAGNLTPLFPKQTD